MREDLGGPEKEQQMPFNKEAGEADDTGLDISSKRQAHAEKRARAKFAKFKSKLSK